MAEGSFTPLVVIVGGLAVYFYWPEISAALGISSTAAAAGPAPAPSSSVPAAAQMTNSSPAIGVPGSTPIGTQGCYSYNNVISCPPGVSPPAPAAPINNCQPGYTVDANGVCIPIPTPTLVAPTIPQIPLPAAAAAALGLTPGMPIGYEQTAVNGALYQNTAAGWVAVQVASGLSGIGRRGNLGRLGQALPITNETLINASHNPDTAAIVANAPQAQLTVPQWNYFYTQASGVLQTIPVHPTGDPGARVSAQTYQQIRQKHGLPVRLGKIRNSAPGAFPLGGIGNGPDRVPFVTPGNRTIYRVPGKGLVVSRMGLIQSGGGDHRWSRSPFPRAANWRTAE